MANKAANHYHADPNQPCQGSVPTDDPPYLFKDCPKQAVCTWNGVSLCEECAEEEERGACDHEKAEAS